MNNVPFTARQHAATDTDWNTTRTTVGVGLHHRCSATFTNADLETPHYAP